MQAVADLNEISLDRLERLADALTESQSGSLRAHQQNARKLDELSRRVDSIELQQKQIIEILEHNSGRLDALEESVAKILKLLEDLLPKMDVFLAWFETRPVGFIPERQGEQSSEGD